MIVLLFWLCSETAIGVGELGDNEHQNYRDSACNSRGAVASIAMREPCNVVTTLTRVAGGQSIMDKMQMHSIFVKVSFLLRWTKRR